MRDVSLTFRQAVNAEETGEAFLILITIDHADLAQPIRVSSDAVDTESRGETFHACPFDLSLPDDPDQGSAAARISIDNVDRDIVIALRSISTAPSVTMELVLASDPDTVEASFEDFELKHADYDALVVQGDLSIESFMSEPFPGDIFSPACFPGVF